MKILRKKRRKRRLQGMIRFRRKLVKGFTPQQATKKFNLLGISPKHYLTGILTSHRQIKNYLLGLYNKVRYLLSKHKTLPKVVLKRKLPFIKQRRVKPYLFLNNPQSKRPFSYKPVKTLKLLVRSAGRYSIPKNSKYRHLTKPYRYPTKVRHNNFKRISKKVLYSINKPLHLTKHKRIYRKP